MIDHMRTEEKKAKHALIAVEPAGRQTHGLSEMDDGFLNTTHVSQCSSLQEESLHAVAVQLDGLGSQVEGSGVTLAVKAVTAAQQEQNQRITTKKIYCTICLKLLSSKSPIKLPTQTHPEITQGSACWSEMLNNRPPRTSTSSKWPSRAIR